AGGPRVRSHLAGRGGLGGPGGLGGLGGLGGRVLLGRGSRIGRGGHGVASGRGGRTDRAGDGTVPPVRRCAPALRAGPGPGPPASVDAKPSYPDRRLGGCTSSPRTLPSRTPGGTCWPGSPSRSTTAHGSASWGRTARASPPCCTCSPATSRRRR